MTSIETITLAAHESACERLARIIRWIVAGWALSMLIMGLAVMMLATYEEEVVTETSEVSQDSGDYGSNLYAGGDMNYGYAGSEKDNGEGSEAQGSGGGSEEPAD